MTWICCANRRLHLSEGKSRKHFTSPIDKERNAIRRKQRSLDQRGTPVIEVKQTFPPSSVAEPCREEISSFSVPLVSSRFEGRSNLLDHFGLVEQHQSIIHRRRRRLNPRSLFLHLDLNDASSLHLRNANYLFSIRFLRFDLCSDLDWCRPSRETSQFRRRESFSSQWSECNGSTKKNLSWFFHGREARH